MFAPPYPFLLLFLSPSLAILCCQLNHKANEKSFRAKHEESPSRLSPTPWKREMRRAAGAASVCVCVVACMCTACVCECEHSVPNELKITCGSAFYAAPPLPTLLLPACLPSGNSLPPGSSLPALWQLYAEGVFIILITPSPHSLSACLPACWQLPPSSLLLGNSTPKKFLLFWACCPCELIVASRHKLQLLPLPFRNTPGHASVNPAPPPPLCPFHLLRPLASLPHCAPSITSKAAAEAALKPLNILEVI